MTPNALKMSKYHPFCGSGHTEAGGPYLSHFSGRHFQMRVDKRDSTDCSTEPILITLMVVNNFQNHIICSNFDLKSDISNIASIFMINELAFVSDLPANLDVKQIFSLWEFTDEGVPACQDNDGARHCLHPPQHAKTHSRSY